jgi:hypothetical protein
MIVALPIILFAQPPSTAEQSITGRIVLEDGQPAAGATIAAYPVGAQSRMYAASRDEAGNFKLVGLAPGSYSLSAETPGFVLGGRSLAENIYRAGESVTLRLVRGGVITGRVTDLAGEPLVGVGINLYRVRDDEGNRARQDWDRDVETDDRGIYRAYGLEPGAYLVGVEVDSGGGYGGRDVPTWYPATTRAAVTEVLVHAGEEVTGIDIRHRGDTGHAVSGTISGETESLSPFGGISVTLVDVATKAPIAHNSVNGDSKSFVVAGLSDGEYELYAQMYLPEGEQAASSLRHVTIKGADVMGIDLKLVRYGAVSGRVLIERPTSNPASNNAANASSLPAKCESKRQIGEILVRARSERRNPRSVNLVRTENSFRANLIAPDTKGEFTIKGLEADSYRLETDLPGESWYVHSITQPAAGAAKRADAARTPINLKPAEKLTGIEIAIAEGAASLSGRVMSAKEGGSVPPRLRVHLVPAEASATEDVLRYREATPDPKNSFEFKHLAPGKYFLLARSVSENEANSDTPRPAAFDSAQRAQLRREAEAAKNEIELKACQRVKDHVLRF